MIKEFVNAWNKNSDILREYIKTHKQEEYCKYKKLVKLIINLVINPESWCDFGNIRELDDGDYQGTLIYVFNRDHYQPGKNDYVTTYVYYGSCSGCDTLQSIHNYCYDELPNEQQVSDYMTLCLHIIQRCKFVGDGEE